MNRTTKITGATILLLFNEAAQTLHQYGVLLEFRAFHAKFQSSFRDFIRMKIKVRLVLREDPLQFSRTLALVGYIDSN